MMPPEWTPVYQPPTVFRVIDELEKRAEQDTAKGGKVTKAFCSSRWILLALGRWPFQTEGKWRAWAWLYYGCTSFFLFLLLLLTMGSFFIVMLSWTFFTTPGFDWDSEQQALLKRNLIPFVLTWSCLLASTVASVSFFWGRRRMELFLRFWDIAAEKMGIEVPADLWRFLWMSNLWFAGFGVLLILSSTVLKIHLAEGGSRLMGVLILKMFIPDINTREDWDFSVRIVGALTMLYSIYASRAFLFIFVFHCKLLRHFIREWNSKLKETLRLDVRHEKDRSLAYLKEEEESRMIFEDHAIICKILRRTGKVFCATLLSYFGSQILNMCFELYYCVMSNKGKGKGNNRLTFISEDATQMDTFVAILLLIQNIYVFLSVSLHAAYVAEEAEKGHELVKATGISVTDSLPRRHLIINLQLSFQQRMCVSGGHYFVVDKPFIVTVLGAVFTYFIIVLQYDQQFFPEFGPICGNNESEPLTN